MQAKTGHETPGNVKRLRNNQLNKEIIKAGREFRLESINTNQVAKVNKATIHSKLSSMEKGDHKTTKTRNKIVKLTIHNRQNNNERA